MEKKTLYYIKLIFQKCFQLLLKKASLYSVIIINYDHIFKEFSLVLSSIAFEKWSDLHFLFLFPQE